MYVITSNLFDQLILIALPVEAIYNPLLWKTQSKIKTKTGHLNFLLSFRVWSCFSYQPLTS